MATAKKKSTKKSTKKTVPVQRSFVRSKELLPFLTFRATHQTTYWVIICLLVLALGIWVMFLTVKVQNLYTQVQLTNSSLNLITPKAHK